MHVEFLVEQAGCSSCAELVRDALEELGEVERIEIDGDADHARVRLASGAGVSVEDVDRALREASVGSGHEYRVQPHSWLAAPA
jgi:hypothetical protein